MLTRDRLVVKLPEPRCRELASRPGCAPFESAGRQMREWVRVELDGHDWESLGRKALASARRGKSSTKSKPSRKERNE